MLKLRAQATPRAREIIGLLTALLIGLFAAYLPYALDHRFYFNDDEQTAPYYLDIGQQLHQGHWPFLTLTTLNGGNLILDWQEALFNPVSLAMYGLLAPMRDLTLTGLAYAGFYICLISMGGYLLARSFCLSRMLSLVAGAVLCTNNYLIFMYGHSWLSCLAGSAWFLWAWAFLQFYRTTGNTGALLGAIVFTYLNLSAGWPHSIVMQGFLVLGYLVELFFNSPRRRFRLLPLVLGMLGTLLLVSPAFLPAILTRPWTSRGLNFSSQGLFMPNLGDFLNLSTLDLMPRMMVFNSTLCAVPLMHLAWFIVPLLPLFRWSMVVETLSHRWALGVSGALGLLFLFGPQSLGPIRWPIRFIPLPHAVILLSFLLLINKAGIFVITPRRAWASGMLVFLSLTSSISTYPKSLELHLFSACLLGFLIWIAVELIKAKAFRGFYLWLLVGVLLGFVGTHLSFKNPFLPDFGSNSLVRTSEPSSQKPFSGYTLCFSEDFSPTQVDWSSEAFLGAQGILTGQRTINGYTSVGHRTFNTTFHAGIRTWMTNPEGVANLFATEPTTGVPLIELLRVNTLIIEKEIALPVARPHLGPHWREAETGRYTVHYERVQPDFTRTTLSWSTPGTIITPSGENPTGEKETLSVKETRDGSTLVFARLWWPGYAATLDGVPVLTQPLKDLLVSIQLPPGARGNLLLTYTPPGYRIGLLLALVGGLLVAASLVLNARAGSIQDHDAG